VTPVEQAKTKSVSFRPISDIRVQLDIDRKRIQGYEIGDGDNFPYPDVVRLYTHDNRQILRLYLQCEHRRDDDYFELSFDSRLVLKQPTWNHSSEYDLTNSGGFGVYQDLIVILKAVVTMLSAYARDGTHPKAGLFPKGFGMTREEAGRQASALSFNIGLLRIDAYSSEASETLSNGHQQPLRP